ncbi:MAG: sugar ABC transporter ATP-binding protein [Gemmatales bacterium]|nr:sugar ABC transporter ATP-binding protein [Gemmatales bacterium]MDW7994551.1 sugar ABC transporter ATP-binding protein [Gemmatales bacterium]
MTSSPSPQPATHHVPLLEAVGISKSFPGVQALSQVSLRLYPGEILAVVGENGAGKSTLMKILAGILQPDQGQIFLEGKPVQFRNVHDAQRHGIALIHQELNLVPNLDIASNIFLGREPCGWPPLCWLCREIYTLAANYAQQLGIRAPLTTLVKDLPLGQQQLVEIAKALASASRILIMDEPTSSLTQRESERLFAIIRQLSDQGVSIIYISHRLREVELIANRVLVLRDGRQVGELQRGQITHEDMVRLMVGRELRQFYHRHFAPSARDKILVTVRDLRLHAQQRNPISFDIYHGEIVGLAGLMGSGRTRLVQTLFGLSPKFSGKVYLHGQEVEISSPADAIQAGIYLIPEDRKQFGLILNDTVCHNISLPSLRELSRYTLVRSRQERTLASQLVQQLSIRTPGLQQMVGLLSGGNQQKTVLAKWLARQPRWLLLDEPTRGIDIYAKSEIYALVDSLAQQGVAILMVSSELEEILGLCDRVLVMHQGELVGELDRSHLSEEAIMQLATGGKHLS